MPFFALASALLLLTTATAQAQAAQVDRIEFTEYGIYTVDRVIQEKDAAGINKATASNVRHAATLRTVPAQIGTTFGFRYKLAGTPNGTPVNLRELVIFPPTGLVPKES